VLCTDRTYPLDDPPAVVWQALEQVDGYQRWWPWLRRFDAKALSDGARWVARIRVPVPWSLRIELELHGVRAPTTVGASVAGDVEGTAVVTVEPAGTGSVIRVRSELAPRHRLLRALNQLVPSVSRRMHDHVIDTAFQQFAERDAPGGRVAGR
jgi:uncharacterized protein YndB with AHSA1/START domain